MTRKFRVGLDCDGVLADFVGGALDVINEKFAPWIRPDLGARDALGKRFLREADVTEWHVERLLYAGLDRERELLRDSFRARLCAPGFCANLREIPGAALAVERLWESTDLWIVTSPLSGSPTWMHERSLWLQRHFGIHDARVIQTGDKRAFDGDVLIDDRPENLLAWRDSRTNRGAMPTMPIALLWTRPWNMAFNESGRGIRRVASWDEVFRVIGLDDAAKATP